LPRKYETLSLNPSTTTEEEEEEGGGGGRTKMST
jgi:hypothetical protein